MPNQCHVKHATGPHPTTHDVVVTQSAQTFSSWENCVQIWVDHNKPKRPFENYRKVLIFNIIMADAVLLLYRGKISWEDRQEPVK